jgi:hypothetical protein
LVFWGFGLFLLGIIYYREWKREVKMPMEGRGEG